MLNFYLKYNNNLNKKKKFIFSKEIDFDMSLKNFKFKRLKNFKNYTKQLMVLQKKKSNTAGNRHLKLIVRYKLLRKNNLLKSKLLFYRKSIGKNNHGQIVGYYRQVGLKRRFRDITNWRLTLINQGILEQIEYNPNHSVLLARIYNPLINYHFYIRYPYGLKLGHYIKTNFSTRNDFFIGDTNKLFSLLTGKPVHNLNFKTKNRIASSAGVFATILQKYINYVLVRFPSKKQYYVLSNTQGTLGRLSNLKYKLCNLSKAGRNRWKGKRPHVRGVAMNPIDHPHGGGQGKTSGGQPSVSAWGKPTKQIKKRKFFIYSKNKKKVQLDKNSDSE